MTFSITARSPDTGQLGVAVITAWFAVGSICLEVRHGLGAVAAQATPSPTLRADCLNGLASGLTPEESISKALVGDPLLEFRQVGLLDSKGRAFAYTGPGCEGASFHVFAENYVIVGNCLSSSRVIEAIDESWNSTQMARTPMAERLLLAISAGQDEGGDKRGAQSAALFVSNSNPLLNVDLRVDNSHVPLTELRNNLNMFRTDFEAIYRNL